MILLLLFILLNYILCLLQLTFSSVSYYSGLFCIQYYSTNVEGIQPHFAIGLWQLFFEKSILDMENERSGGKLVSFKYFVTKQIKGSLFIYAFKLNLESIVYVTAWIFSSRVLHTWHSSSLQDMTVEKWHCTVKETIAA